VNLQSLSPTVVSAVFVGIIIRFVVITNAYVETNFQKNSPLVGATVAMFSKNKEIFMKKTTALIPSLLIFFTCFRVCAEPFVLESTDFKNNSTMPVALTCYGRDRAPGLAWRGAPEKTQSFVLIMQDPDAPNQPWTDWLVFNIPAKMTALASGASFPEPAITIINSHNKLGYSGPCPPSGLHHYIFSLYALKKTLSVNAHDNQTDILNAMQGLILKKARIIGLYQK
jgi:Raf kinase inhibitor-like YbhB/YbcL family protein